MNTPQNVNSITAHPTKEATVFGYVLRIAGFFLLVIAIPLIIFLPLGLVGLLFSYIGIRLVREGRIISQVQGEALLRHDSRPPVLYLRDFRNDSAPPLDFTSKTSTPSDRPALSPWLFTTDEERLAAVMNQVGPFITLGAPERKKVTDFGAARLYVKDEEWMTKIKELLGQAQLVVICVNPLQEGWGFFFRETLEHSLIEKSSLKLNEDTRPDDYIPREVGYGVWWELAQVKAMMSPERILLYLPFKAKESVREELYQDVRGLIQECLGCHLPPRLGRSKFIGIEDDGTGYLLNYNGPPTLGIVNLYGKTLSPFFQRLGGCAVREIKIHYFVVIELLYILVNAVIVLFLLLVILRLIWGAFWGL